MPLQQTAKCDSTFSRFKNYWKIKLILTINFQIRKDLHVHYRMIGKSIKIEKRESMGMLST